MSYTEELEGYVLEARSIGLSFDARDHKSPWFRYITMRLQGQSQNMAEMLATRSFPGIRGTDSSFMKGTHFQENPVDSYRYAAAAASGVDTNGKRYISGLARFPNDPEAWVSGLGDVDRVCRERGWRCSGAIDVNADVPAYDAGDAPVAPDIVEDAVAARLEAYHPAEQTPELIAEITHKAREAITYKQAPVADPDDLDLKVSNHDFEHIDGEGVKGL